MKKPIRRLGTIGVACLILIVAITLSTANCIKKINEKKTEEEALKQELLLLREEEESLNSEYTKLSDPLYIGKYAREKFLYSKEGETVIKLPVTP